MFRTVQISLSSHDLNFTVSHILKSCGMLEDLVTLHQSGKQQEKVTVASPFSGPVHWLHVYNQFKDRQCPVGMAHVHNKGKYTLADFLSKNIASVKEKLENSATLRKENVRLSEKICRELNLRKLVSECKWGLGAYQGSLQSLLQLCATNKAKFCSLEGRTVVFTNWTDVDPQGKVMLGVQDVPEFWLSVSSG